MNDIHIAVLLGTTRHERESINPAQLIVQQLSGQVGVTVSFIDPQTLNFTDEGESGKDPVYSEITARADAFVIVAPEYNHGYPGSLKHMLDSEYSNYLHKPVALVGVSSGGWGGTRVCEALLPVCHRLGLVTIQQELYFPSVTGMFDESGKLKPDFTDRYTKNIQAVATELIWFARILKQARS